MSRERLIRVDDGVAAFDWSQPARQLEVAPEIARALYLRAVRLSTDVVRARTLYLRWLHDAAARGRAAPPPAPGRRTRVMQEIDAAGRASAALDLDRPEVGKWTRVLVELPPEDAEARLPGFDDVRLAVDALVPPAARGAPRRDPVPADAPPASSHAADAPRARLPSAAERERRDHAVARVERGFDAVRGLARTARSSRIGGLARRIPGAAALDDLSGGRIGELASASWRWLERFGTARAMASPAGAAAEVTAEVDPRAAGLDPSGGAPLPAELQSRMARLFGRDLSHVRVHTGGAPDAAARALGARAVTVGSHIFFADGQFAPGTLPGDRLLIHELTHVAQHDDGRLPGVRGDRVRVSQPSDPEEVEARAAERLAEQPSRPAEQPSRPAGARRIRRVPAAGPSHDAAAPQTAAPQTAAPRAPTTGGQASRGLGDLVTGGAAFLVRRVSPGLADLIERGPTQVLRQAIQPAISSWVGALTRGVDLRTVATSLTSGFTSAFQVLQGARNGDQRCCDTLTHGIDAIRQLGDALIHNPAVQTIRAVIGRISGIIQQVLRVVLAPVFDVVKDLVGGVWNVLSGMASTIAGWLRAVRDAAGSAVDWVAHQLGFPAASGEGGLMDWLRHKASEIWDQVKETLRPVATPLMAIGGVLVALSPFGPMLAAIAVVPPLVRAAQWLWEHRSDPNIIRSAHQEMGHTMLPRLLEAGQGFVGAIRGAATWLGTQVVQLGSGLLQLAGALSGVPLLEMAQGFVRDLQQDVQQLVTWSQGAFHDAVEWCQTTYTRVANFIRPYQEVLCSIALAVANPPMIPIILAGWAWRWLPDCIKPPIVDLLLDVVIGVLRAVPIVPMFGLLWPILKNFVVGMLQAFRNRSDADKIALTNKLARLISGASPEFLIGFVVGVLKGVWDGIKQPFEAIWMLAEGLTTVVEYFQRLAGGTTWQPRRAEPAAAAGAPAPQAPAAAPTGPAPNSTAPAGAPTTAPPVSVPALTSENIQSAVGGVASSLAAQQREREDARRSTPGATGAPAPGPAAGARPTTPQARADQLGQVAGQAGQMAGQLSAPVGVVSSNFWPAVQQLFQGGGHMTLDDFVARLSGVWQAAQHALQSLGGQLATMIIDFFLQDSAERTLGEGVGYLVGMFAFQALLDYLSAGTWTGAMQVVQQIARFLNWPNAALGEAMELLARLGRYVLDGVRSLGRMLSGAASGALGRVLGAFTRIGEMLGEFAGRLVGRAGEGAAAHAAESAAAHGAESAAAHGAESAAAHTAEGSAAREGAAAEREGAAAEREGQAAEREGAGSAAERAAVKERELPEALAVSRGITMAAERGHVPAPLLVTALDALKERYTWIRNYRVEARGGATEILLIASEFVIDPRYDAQGDEDLARWQARLQAERDAAEAAGHADPWEQASARLEEVDARAARQAQIARGEQEGIEALAQRREQLWANERLSGGRRLDEAFWRRVDDPDLNRQQLQQLRQELEAIRQEVGASRRGRQLIRSMDEDLSQQVAKLDHRIARDEARAATTLSGHGAQTDAQLRERILRGEPNVYAVDRAQAQRVSNQIESEMRAAARARGEPFDPTHFHGPESHAGTGSAPGDPHLNVKSNLPGADFEVHIYFPP